MMMMTDVRAEAAQVPSAFNFFNGRAAGRMAAFMANKGTLGGKKLLSEEAWNQAHAEPKVMGGMFVNCKTSFTQGGLHNYS